MNRPTSTFSCKLPPFEGPLDLLLYLAQKEELDLDETPLLEIINQFLQEPTFSHLDSSSEFVILTASLMLLKSQKLLPKEIVPIDEQEEIDPKFEVIHKLLEYVQFKKVAKTLSEREETQHAYFPRGTTYSSDNIPKPPGVGHLSLDEIASFFQNALEKAKDNAPQLIEEEEWTIRDLIAQIRHDLHLQTKLPLRALLNPTKTKLLLIVTFLALLELMKLNELSVIYEQHTQTPWVYLAEKRNA